MRKLKYILETLFKYRLMIAIAFGLMMIVLAAAGCANPDKAYQTHGYCNTYSGNSGGVVFKWFAGSPTLSQRQIDSLKLNEKIQDSLRQVEFEIGGETVFFTLVDSSASNTDTLWIKRKVNN